ncbi:response regulator [Pseudenhygromyxa sp. WMMC2535]|uniref:response regulator n=1 Tax=Pseudenhygromyxa sp. WMMC2535 TaxID=2712867 RepID=UPI001557EE9A|nr:response regulator [Pseudenhygromyxa sp. WMMC2535]
MDQDGQKRVLIVDDDIDVLKSLRRLIQEYAEVTVALGAEAALEHMEKANAEDGTVYDVVLVDFNMNGKNGAWLLERVREKYPDCERMLLSGSSQFDLSNFITPGLVNRFLEKPLDFDELIEALGAED